METRQSKLLKSIIEEYIKTAEPVGSNLLVEKCFKNISSATIRSEMSELEKQGYIVQPHTSAGRIPTEAGYKFYIENFLMRNCESNASTYAKASVDKKLRKCENYLKMGVHEISNTKAIAKRIAEISGEAVIVTFSKDDVYYTGISNVFSQPEFREYDLAFGFTSIFDHLDEVISEIYDDITSEVEVRFGEENPFGADCGLIITKSRNKLLAIIGPIRMDYRRNINLLRYAKTLIWNI